MTAVRVAAAKNYTVESNGGKYSPLPSPARSSLTFVCRSAKFFIPSAALPLGHQYDLSLVKWGSAKNGQDTVTAKMASKMFQMDVSAVDLGKVQVYSSLTSLLLTCASSVRDARVRE
jgi:hypothetical protein